MKPSVAAALMLAGLGSRTLVLDGPLQPPDLSKLPSEGLDRMKAAEEKRERKQRRRAWLAHGKRLA